VRRDDDAGLNWLALANSNKAAEAVQNLPGGQ
jgi:hypothetical protein